jgi:Caspase domain
MRAISEDDGGRRLGLVIATSSYTDSTLAKLRAPGHDASELATVLEDPDIGGFTVEALLDSGVDSVRRSIARFCSQAGPRDLALVYLSCHGVLDDRGRLYYATSDTERELLSVTAVPATWLNEQLDDSRCRRQILVLDCCHSGAFARGAKGERTIALHDELEGRGRVVLTASRATEYSFEGDEVLGTAPASIFTRTLVEGLRTGAADSDRNGLITVTELYDYTYPALKASEARQTPSLWAYGAEGNLLVAKSPLGAVIEPAPLPEDLRVALESPRPGVREGVVLELGRLLTGSHPGLALTAREELRRVAEEDVPRVAMAARAVLSETPEQAVVEEEAAPPEPEDAAEPEPSPPEPEPAPPEPEPPADEPAAEDPLARFLSKRADSPHYREAAKIERPAERAPTLWTKVNKTWLLAGLGALLVAGLIVVLIVRNGDGEFSSGAPVTLQQVGNATERAKAYLFETDSSSPLELGLQLNLAQGQSYKLLLFDDVESARSFETLPTGARFVDSTGRDGRLDPIDIEDATYRYDNVDMPDDFRDSSYVGIVRISGSKHALRLYASVSALPDPY